MLLRHGQRDKDGKLMRNDQGLERGAHYIRDIVDTYSSDRPAERMLFAPTPICRETTEVFIHEETNVIVSDSIIAEDPSIHSQDSAWDAVIAHLGIAQQTLADLKKAEEVAVKAGKVPPHFLHNEGLRMFSAITKVVAEVEDGSMVVCVMHSPLIEAVVLYVWGSIAQPSFQTLRPLKEIEFLEHLDHYMLLFRGSVCRYVVWRSHDEKIKAKRGANALALSLTNKVR